MAVLKFLLSYMISYCLYQLVMCLNVQYRHSNPAPVDRTPASAWFYKHSGTTCHRNKSSKSMTYVATFSCEVMFASIPRKLVAIRCAVVYYAWAAVVYRAGIKCRHCTLQKHRYIASLWVRFSLYVWTSLQFLSFCYWSFCLVFFLML